MAFVEAKIDVKGFVLSVEEGMTSGIFIIVGTSAFSSVHSYIGDLSGFARSNLFLFNLDLDSLCVAAFCVFQKSLTELQAFLKAARARIHRSF